MPNNKAQNTDQSKILHSRRRTILLIMATVLAYLIIKSVLFLTAKPKITVDYLAMHNKLTKPADYNPDDNAALLYQKALDEMHDWLDWPYKIRSEILDDEAWPGDTDPNILRYLKNWFDSKSESFEYAREAVCKPYCWIELQSPNDNIRNSGHALSLNAMRRLAKTLAYQAKIKAMEGRIQESFKDLKAVFNEGQLLMGEKSLVEQLIGMGIRHHVYNAAYVIVDRCEIEVGPLRELQKSLEKDSIHEPLRWQTDKLRAYELVQRLFTDDGKGDGHLIAKEYFYECTLYGQGLRYPRLGRHVPPDKIGRTWKYLKEFCTILWPVITSESRRDTIEKLERSYDLIEDLSPQAPCQLHTQNTFYTTELDTIVGKNEICSILIPRNYRIIELSHKNSCEHSALLTTIALLRHKKEQGKLPETLEALVSMGYLQAIPLDPYSNGPLIYKPSDNNFILYSVGADFDDDGGKHDSKWGKDDGDYVFWPVKRPEKTTETKNDTPSN